MKNFPVSKSYGDNQISCLENIEVGDEFYIWPHTFGESYMQIVKCESISPKYAKIGGYKYRIEDARPQNTGGSYSSAPYLHILTLEKKAEIREQNERIRLVKTIKAVEKWQIYETEALREICKIIDPLSMRFKKDGK